MRPSAVRELLGEPSLETTADHAYQWPVGPEPPKYPVWYYENGQNHSRFGLPYRRYDATATEPKKPYLVIVDFGLDGGIKEMKISTSYTPPNPADRPAAAGGPQGREE